ncbi:MAG: BTAD domain-containing putative transcriptional regulator [Caldilineaceae bacterium]
MRLELTLFGTPEIRWHGQIVTGFRSSKAQALLYYLAVTGRAQARPTLAGLLWGDQPEAAARTSLSKCLSNLRALVGDAVVVERQTVAFNRHHLYHLDTEHFLAGIGQPPTPETIHTWQATLARYRGDFLEGFYVREAPDFEQWVLVQRAYYRESVVQGLHTLANWHEQQGDLLQAISYTRRLLTLEPWREEAHRQLMMRLAHNGQRAAALAQYLVCCQVLDEELGVAPDQETMTLYEQIRDDKAWLGKRNGQGAGHASPPLPTSPTALPDEARERLFTVPAATTPLIGRAQELAELSALLTNPICRLITLFGLGGIGKTRLALAAASEPAVTTAFPAGVAFVALAGVTTPQFLPDTLLNALALVRQSAQSPQQQLLTWLRPRRLLLVLDNYEHLLPDVALLLELLQNAPQVTLLVTSRERLQLQAEWLLTLTGLAYPTELSVLATGSANQDAAEHAYPALALFWQRVRQLHRHFAPDLAERQAILQICRLTEGIPLALELAAGAAQHYPCVQIAAELAHGQPPAARPLRDRPLRHQSLHASLDHSWRLLTPAEQHLLCQLAVFRGGFYGSAAQQVAGVALPELATLVDKSLVQLGTNPLDAERYAMHELIRQYLFAKLQAAGELTAAQQRHCHYYLALAQEAEAKLHTTEHRQMLDCLEINHDNLRAALTWALTNACDLALALAVSLGSFWRHRGYIREGRDWLQQALQKTATPSPLRVKALVRLGDLMGAQGERELAFTYHQQSLTLARELDDQLGIALALRSIGWYYIHLDKARTIRYFGEALTLLRTLDDERRIAQLLGDLAQLVFEQENDVAKTRQYLQESLLLARKNGDARSLMQALNVEAQLASRQGDYAAEMRLLQETLPLTQMLGIKQDEAWILCALAETARYVGEVELARRSGEASRTLFQALGSKSGLAVVLHHLAMVALFAHDLSTAQQHFAESLQLSQATSRQPLIARCLAGLAGVASRLGDGQRAARLLSAAHSLFTTIPPFLTPADQVDYEQFREATHTQLTQASYTTAWQEGATLSVEQAVAYALAEPYAPSQEVEFQRQRT